MRVPNALQGSGALSHLDRIRGDINRAASEMASGKRVQVPSDDPFAAARGGRLRGRLDTLGEYVNATDRAEAELFNVDIILDDIEKLMDVAASSAAAGRSGTATTITFQALAQEVDGVRQELLRLANSRHNGTYLFAGQQTLTQPFTETLGVVSYAGDGVAPTMRVSDQAVVETTIPGSDLFVGTLDVFQVLGDLRDALTAEDPTAVGVEAQNVEQIARRFSQFRARAGYTLQELSRYRVRLSEENVQKRTELSAEVDANLVDAIARLNAGNTALEATLGAGARLLSVSLLDVLG